MNPYLGLVRVFRRGPVLPAPYKKALRHKPTFFGKMAMERWVSCGRSVPADLKAIATLRAGSLVGCLW